MIRDRDYVGYANAYPPVRWPGDADLAISVVIAYEEGSEHAIAFGDAEAEPVGEWGHLFQRMPQGIRNVTNESLFEYG